MLLRQIFEESATELADEVTAPRPDGEEKVEKIQVNNKKMTKCIHFIQPSLTLLYL